MANPYKLTGTNTILDLVKAAGTAETYRDSVNKSYAKPWKLFSSPPDSVWQEYKELEHDRDTKRYDIYHNPNPTEGLIKYSQTESDATGVAHDNIDGILAGNRAETAYNTGTIGPIPEPMIGGVPEDTLMEIAMGSAFPGAAIGRTTKAAITGGQGIINNMPKKLVDEALEQGGFKGLTSQVNWNNKLNSTRLLMEKALSKWGVDDRARKLMDPISEMLRTSKYKQN